MKNKINKLSKSNEVFSGCSLFAVVIKCLLILLLPKLAFAIGTIINTQSGIVYGATVYYNQTAVRTFLGIPFAEPPVGDLRFRKTVPVQTKSTPIFANTFPPACVQYFPYAYPWPDRLLDNSEDCLYLNIWSPESSCEQTPKAVMFWLYGGGLTYGSNRMPVYEGHILAAEGDVIVVTINHRLGVFGFLSTDTEDAPGNMGLYDVLEALKWVNNNIHAFGGDVNRITVFGQSSGSQIAALLCYSPLSRGLFQQAIMESGAPTTLDGNVKEKNWKLGQQLAEAVGCASNHSSFKMNPHQVVNCLRGKDAMYLAITLNSFFPSKTRSFFAIPGNKFIPRDPRKEILRGNFHDVPIMIGNVKDEGSYSLTDFKPDVFGPFGEKNPSVNKSYGEELILEKFKLSNFEDPQAVVDYYLSGLQEYDYDIIRSQVYHSFGDFQVFCPTLYLAESFGKKRKSVYAYYFSHRPSITPWAWWMGVAHFSEIQFVFGRPLENGSTYTESEKELSKIMIKLWTNFAKYGSPARHWKQFTPSDPYFLDISLSGSPGDYLEAHKYNCDFFRKYFLK